MEKGLIARYVDRELRTLYGSTTVSPRQSVSVRESGERLVRGYVGDWEQSGTEAISRSTLFRIIWMNDID